MNFMKKWMKDRRGDMSFGGGALLWLLGVPLPIILLISMMRGCR